MGTTVGLIIDIGFCLSAMIKIRTCKQYMQGPTMSWGLSCVLPGRVAAVFHDYILWLCYGWSPQLELHGPPDFSLQLANQQTTVCAVHYLTCCGTVKFRTQSAAPHTGVVWQAHALLVPTLSLAHRPQSTCAE